MTWKPVITENQELEQCQADLAQQQQNAVYIAKLEERFLQRKQDLQQCQADLEQREITIAQNGDLITDLKTSCCHKVNRLKLSCQEKSSIGQWTVWAKTRCKAFKRWNWEWT